MTKRSPQAVRSRFRSFPPEFLYGLLLAVGFPPIGLWPIAWLGMALWLRRLYRLSIDTTVDIKVRCSRAALSGFIFFMAVHIGGYYWIAYVLREFAALPWIVSGLVTLLIFVLLSAFTALMCWVLPRWLRKPSLRKPWVSVAVLVLWTIVWDTIDTRPFPWSPSQAVGTDVLLMASVYYLGSFGWRVLFLGSAALAARSWRVAGIGAAVMLVIGYGAGYSAKTTLEAANPARQPVFLLQGNVGNYEKKLVKLGNAQPTVEKVLEIHDTLLREAELRIASSEKTLQGHPGGGADQRKPEPWIVWPETAFPGYPVDSESQQAWVNERTKRIGGLQLMGGYARGRRFEGRTLDFNIIALFHEAQGLVASYRKHILMPFGEYIPGGDTFPVLYRWLSAVNHFDRGSELTLLPHPNPQGPVFLPLVCYEVLSAPFVSAFVAEARKAYPGRAIVVVNASNDSWYGPTSEPSQHSLLARWEIARFGLPFLRPTNTGYSQIVAPWGEVLAQGPRDETILIEGLLPVPALTSKN